MIETFWSHLYENYSTFELVSLGTFSLTMAVYWGMGLSLLALDYL